MKTPEILTLNSGWEYMLMFTMDIRNPQATRDAPQGEPLGTFIIDADGDIGIESGRMYLRKRIFRRLSTPKGSMFHDPNYGVMPQLKGLYRPADLRKLVQDVEAQVKSEPDVIACRATVRELTPGVVVCELKVTDKLGVFDVSTGLWSES